MYFICTYLVNEGDKLEIANVPEINKILVKVYFKEYNRTKCVYNYNLHKIQLNGT